MGNVPGPGGNSSCTQEIFEPSARMLLWLLSIFPLLVLTKKLPDIYWNSTNPLVERFAAIGDTLDIYCPHYGPDVHPADTEQVIIYRVPERDYENCRLSSAAEELRRCVRPYERERWTASFRTFSPSPSALHYKAGETYYFISTSTGSASGLPNAVGGLCASHNLKMIIHVTDRNGDIGPHHRRHHHHHHKSTTPPSTTTTEKSNSLYQNWRNNPLWEQFIDKLSQDHHNGRREPTRGERVVLDDPTEDEKNAYEALPLELDRVEFQIHEIGEVDSLFSSSSTSKLLQTTIGALLFLLLRI